MVEEAVCFPSRKHRLPSERCPQQRAGKNTPVEDDPAGWPGAIIWTSLSLRFSFRELGEDVLILQQHLPPHRIFDPCHLG